MQHDDIVQRSRDVIAVILVTGANTIYIGLRLLGNAFTAKITSQKKPKKQKTKKKTHTLSTW